MGGEEGLIGSGWSAARLQARREGLLLQAERLRARALELEAWLFERSALREEQRWRSAHHPGLLPSTAET